jgi:uncharacterized protein YeaC (DUF1315 family)
MFDQLAARLPSYICREFRLALARGHWGSGLVLTPEQRATCEQALFFHDNDADNITH